MKFKEMLQELASIETAYKTQYEAEKEFNIKLKKYEALKKEYLLLLNEIAYIKNQQVNILREEHAVK